MLSAAFSGTLDRLTVIHAHGAQSGDDSARSSQIVESVFLAQEPARQVAVVARVGHLDSAPNPSSPARVGPTRRRTFGAYVRPTTTSSSACYRTVRVAVPLDPQTRDTGHLRPPETRAGARKVLGVPRRNPTRASYRDRTFGGTGARTPPPVPVMGCPVASSLTSVCSRRSRFQRAAPQPVPGPPMRFVLLGRCGSRGAACLGSAPPDFAPAGDGTAG